MPVKDRDGKVYKIRGPDNPPNKIPDPKDWDKSNVVLINFNDEQEVVEDKKPVVLPEEVPTAEEFINELSETTVETDPVIDAPIPASALSVTSGLEAPLYAGSKLDHARMTVYCLPASKISTFDKKVIFEAVMLDEEDFYCVFWTPYEVPLDSIVYPKNFSKRWWKVENISVEGTGFLVTCILTDLNPDFTD